jgi:CRP/FNR family transcriptional regulator, cyclic AMP receptor protein
LKFLGFLKRGGTAVPPFFDESKTLRAPDPVTGITDHQRPSVTGIAYPDPAARYFPPYQTQEDTMLASKPTPDLSHDRTRHAVEAARTARPIASVVSADRRFQALKRVDMFSVLDEAEMRRVAESLLERHYASGSAIVHADDPAGGHFFIVAEGEVAVVLETPDGKETVLATLQPGDFFGEMSLLDESPRAATARAVRPTRLMLLRREDFRRHLRECPQMAFALLVEMNRRLRQSNRKVMGLSYRSMHARVAGAILGLMEEKGVRQREEGGAQVLIRNRPTQQFLAEMAGTTRESVSRTLAAWGRKGLLRKKGRDLFILEEEQIRGFAGC